MIPPEKTAAVNRALQEVFGSSPLEDIRRMTKGLSSDLVFRIVVPGSPFLLRCMTQINETNDPGRVFACMQIAADAGLAPRVLYANAGDGLAIIDWIETAPFSTRQALAHLPAALRKLHSLPPFPKAFNYVTAHKFFIWRLRSSGLLPQAEIEEAFHGYERICAVYPRLAGDLVSCHMDLKPENILFDGSRVWLIDWMAASVNDRYFDLAIVANFVVHSEADEPAFLGRYLGRMPDEYERARLFLMAQVLHLLAAAVFLLLGSQGQPIARTEDSLSFRDFHDKVWAGEIGLADNPPKIAYCLVHWQRLLQNIRQPRFTASLRTVAERNARLDGLSLLLPKAPQVTVISSATT